MHYTNIIRSMAPGLALVFWGERVGRTATMTTQPAAPSATAVTHASAQETALAREGRLACPMGLATATAFAAQAAQVGRRAQVRRRALVLRRVRVASGGAEAPWPPAASREWELAPRHREAQVGKVALLGPRRLLASEEGGRSNVHPKSTLIALACAKDLLTRCVGSCARRHLSP